MTDKLTKFVEEAKVERPDDVWKEDVWAIADYVYEGKDEDGEWRVSYTEDELIEKAENHDNFRYDKDSKTLYININLSKLGRVMAAPLRIPMDYKGISRKFIVTEEMKND